MSEIHAAMAAIQQEVQGIPKARMNEGQKYRFRGIDQVAEMLHPLLSKHNVVVLPRVVAQQRDSYETRNGGTMHSSLLTIEWHFTARDGSAVVVTTVGEGADSGDKATNKAMTAAQKYALTLAFTVPWSDQADGDAESPEPRQRRETAARSPQKRSAEAGTTSVGRDEPAPSSSLPQGWYDERIGFGKFKDYTWAQLAKGKSAEEGAAEPGGGRWSWLDYMRSTIESSANATPRDKAILDRVRKTMDAISKGADKRGAAA